MENIELDIPLVPSKDKVGNRVFELASTSTDTGSIQTSGGTVSNAYKLQPIMWIRKALDCAKERMRFLQIVRQETLPPGHKDLIMTIRKNYLADSSWEASSAEYDPAGTSEIAWTEITTQGGVQFTPTNYNYGVFITNEHIRTNVINSVQYCREELSYKYENSVDSAIRDALIGTIVASGGTPSAGATEASSTAAGSQTIFGGDATDADNSLDDGDTLTPELIKKARRLLQSTKGYYWNSNTWTASSATFNPWVSEPNEPFVLLIAPEQEESLLNESQFTSAAEYGSQAVILSGEIGQYMDVKVVTTTKMPSGGNTDIAKIQGNSVSFDTNVHMCAMVKSQRVGAIVFGRKAEFKVFDWPSADGVRMKLSMAYAADSLYEDAQVRIFVTDV